MNGLWASKPFMYTSDLRHLLFPKIDFIFVRDTQEKTSQTDYYLDILSSKTYTK